MKFKNKFRLITWSLRIAQLSFLIFSIYAWILFREKIYFIHLFLALFFMAYSFLAYILQVQYRREFGVKLRTVFKNDMTKKLNRRGRRNLKRFNK